MKFNTFFEVLLGIAIIGVINGEVDFCLELDGEYVSQNKGSLEEVPALLEQVNREIEESVKEADIPQGTANYTYFYLNISHPAITISGDLTNGTTFTDENQILRLWTITTDGLEVFNFTFPRIFVDGSYNLSGYVGAHDLFNIYGNGKFYMNMTNFTVAAVTGLTINSTAVCLPLSVNVYLHGFESHFHDFMGGDEDLGPLLNRDIQWLVPQAVPIIFRESMDGLAPYVQAIIDNILHNSKLKSLPKLLYILAKNKAQLPSVLKKKELLV